MEKCVSDNPNKEDRSTLRLYFSRFFRFARIDTKFIVLTVVLVLCLTVTNTLLVWLIGKPIDQLQEGKFELVGGALLLLSVIAILNQALQFSSSVMANWIGLRFVGRLRQHVLHHLLNNSISGKKHLQRGDILSRLSSDVDKVQDMILEQPFFVISHLLTIVFYCSMLFWIDTYLALLALLFLPVFYIHQHLFSPYKKVAGENFYTRNGSLLAFEEQSLANMRGINAFNAEDRLANQHIEAFESARRWAMKMRLLDQGFNVTLAVLIFICAITIVHAGVEKAETGSLTSGTLVSFLIYLGYLSVPVRGIAQAPMQWFGNVGAAERVMHLLEIRPSAQDKKHATQLPKSTGHIRFNDVVFSYDKEKPILHGVNFEVTPGERVAIIGPSGAGKSTLINLLMRFYDPAQGCITIDGVDISDCTTSSLRDQISVVWQSPLTINASIRDNLLLANPEATPRQLVCACELSEAWSFISSLDHELDTRIGDGGIELSGGQIQRIAIAQAMLRLQKTSILILDEATSALDSQAERSITATLDELSQTHTVLIIAHRYSSIKNVDKIIYMNSDGSISVGSHSELYLNHPEYRRALSWQSGVASAV